MTRQSIYGDGPWHEQSESLRLRARVFERTPEQMLSGRLLEFAPGAPPDRLHMHYGIQEMFFVLSGTPALHTADGEERLAPGDVVQCPEGRPGLHTFSNPGEEPARLIAVSARRTPELLVYPEEGVAWVATRNPDFPPPAEGDPGMIARFEFPPEPASG